MNSDTVLYQLTETSAFMMSFVIVTKKNNAIIIDGGREEDIPLLKEYVGGRHISAWIITHGHQDHISGMMTEYLENKWRDFDIEKIYCKFPPEDAVPEGDLEWCIPAFNKHLPEFKEKVHFVEQGESVQIDELKIDFIFTYHSEIDADYMNNSSMVFKVNGPKKSVIFLGDIGPESGDHLYRESKHLLKADIVQMSHHGGSCCGMEVYSAIKPEACLWCCRKESYEGKGFGARVFTEGYADNLMNFPLRRFPVTVTREWMDFLGVKTHYVSGYGTNKIII